MKEVSKTFPSSSGISSIAFYEFIPETDAKGIIQISHGMCEGIWRYKDFASYLCSLGYIVCGHDHAGHGNSVKNNDELGYFAHKNGYKCLIKDVHTASMIIKKDFPNIPICLLCHSMGSFIARACLAEYHSIWDASVIIGTSGGSPMIKLGIMTASLTAKIKGERYRSPLLQKLSFGNYNKDFEPHKSEFDWLSSDEEVVKAYEAEPKCSFVFTASAFKDLFKLLNLVSKSSWADSIEKDMPILLTAGDKDPVGNNGKGVEKVFKRLKKAGVEDVSIRLYENGRHEILNEVNKQEVYLDISNWLSEKFV